MMTENQRNSKSLAQLPRGSRVYQPLLWERYPISKDKLTTKQITERFHLRTSVVRQAMKKRFLELNSAVLLYKSRNYWRVIRT